VDNDLDGREEVQTEMVQLDLAGLSPRLGPVRVRLNPHLRSLGQLEEATNNTAGVLDVRPFTNTALRRVS